MVTTNGVALRVDGYGIDTNNTSRIYFCCYSSAFRLTEFLMPPLDPNPITDLDKFVNRLRVQYRTLQLEFRVTDVSARLVILFFFKL